MVNEISINELIEMDKTFSESAFIAKVDNIFIMFLTAIMTDNLKRVKHKLSDELYSKYELLLNDLNSKNQRQMYDELNVKTSKIHSINILDDKYIINVLLTARYMDYVIDKINGDYVSGINDRRIQKDYYLTFEKYINAKIENAARKCPTCGASANANSTGICSYCHSVYNTKDYDWVLVGIKEI